ncbi:MAG: NAD kinase [Pseudomonadota bacterium]
MSHSSPAIAFVAGPTEDARRALYELTARYGNTPIQDASHIVALGGDGLMLRTLHAHMDSGKPIYGMNRGSVGFLMNDYHLEDLPERLEAAARNEIHPLAMHAVDIDGETHEALAINEVSLLRQTYQAAKLSISVDDKVRLAELACDGVLVATPAGSTAYNLSAHGPIIPIKSPLLALTPISPFRPRRWRGALLPNDVTVHIEVKDPTERLVSAAADHFEFRNIRSVTVSEDHSHRMEMMFDPDGALDERIIREQFED